MRDDPFTLQRVDRTLDSGWPYEPNNLFTAVPYRSMFSAE